MNRDPRDYVDHIAEAIRHIEQWTAEGREQFLSDIRTRAAMIRMLQELSESVRRLYPVLHEKYPLFPWRDVMGFRNVLVHDYLGLNHARIWDIATTSVPLLKSHIEQMLADLA